MTEISVSPNEEKQEQEVSIKEFVKTQKVYGEHAVHISETCYYIVHGTVLWAL